LGIDIPAPAGGTNVAVALTPATAGTVPATVNIPEGQMNATFSYVDASMVSSASLTATLGSSTATSAIQINVVPQGLVINEIDYDNVGTDGAEYVEIYNASSAPIALTGYSLVLVNGGNGSVYKTMPLASAGTLGAGQYLVVGATMALAGVPMGQLTLDQGNV